MPPISNQKKDKISEHILSLLFDNFPKSLFTSHVAREIARDEEFTKKLLEDLKDKNIIIPIKKNKSGSIYLKRTRWRLANRAHRIFQNKE